MIVTNLNRMAQPCIRFDSKDVIQWNSRDCECGRTFRLLEGGVIGRIDDITKVKGVLFAPSACEEIIRSFSELGNEYQIVVPKMGSGQHIRIRVEPDTSEVSEDRMARAVEKFIETVKYRITITPDVEIAGIGELPRFELKAKRLIRE